MAKEFEKSATVLSSPPWDMHKIAAYLRELIKGSHCEDPPNIQWVRVPQRLDGACVVDTTVLAMALDFSVFSPAPVSVVPTRPAPAPKPLAAPCPKVQAKRVRIRAKSAPENPPPEVADHENLFDEEDIAPSVHVPGGGAAAATTKKVKLGALPADMRGKTLGCGKCTQRSSGCSQCRTRIGLVVGSNRDWHWPS